jgi:hypothetical protein
MASDRIVGGYYLKARKIQSSWIAHAPPHVREIWDWLLMNANFRDRGTLKAGQIATSYNEIREGLHWMVGYRKERYTKSQCEIAMKLLTKATMITTMKTTRGLIITINNYLYYQNPQNYENHNENYTRATRKPHESHTITEECNKEKNVNNSIELLRSSARNRKRVPCPTLEFVPPGVWEGITEEIMTSWSKAYPACDIRIELAKAAQYVIANPNKRKKNWYRFLVNWLGRAQERGGTFRGFDGKPTPTMSWAARKEAELESKGV